MLIPAEALSSGWPKDSPRGKRFPISAVPIIDSPGRGITVQAVFDDGQRLDRRCRVAAPDSSCCGEKGERVGC